MVNEVSPSKNPLTTGLDNADHSKSSKVTLVVAGIFLILGGLALLLTSLFLIPSSLNEWKITSFVGASVLMGAGVAILLVGILRNSCVRKNHLPSTTLSDKSQQNVPKVTSKAKDSVSDYDLTSLKQIADEIIMSPYLRNLIRGDIYDVQCHDFEVGDVVKRTRYPSTVAEIEEYERRVPLIVQNVRAHVEKELQITIPISELVAVLEKHHRTLFPYIF